MAHRAAMLAGMLDKITVVMITAMIQEPLCAEDTATGRSAASRI
jgi:hypothetical protein